MRPLIGTYVAGALIGSGGSSSRRRRRERRGAALRRGPKPLWLATVVALTAAALCLLFTAHASASLYWAEAGNETIGRANLDGRSPTHFGTVWLPRGVAVDGEHYYWASLGGNYIGRANLDGSGGRVIVNGASAPFGVAVDGQHVYWTNMNTNTIGRANLDGTEVQQDFITGVHNPQGIAVDAEHIYWANDETGKIGRAKLDGTSVENKFIYEASHPRGVAVDGEHVYWVNLGTETIGRANLDGSNVDQSFLPTLGPATGIAVDAWHIYWANTNYNAIGRANLYGNGIDQTLVIGAVSPVGVAVGGGGTTGSALASPYSVDFGDQAVGTLSQAQTVWIGNESIWTLHLGEMELEGANPADFAYGFACSGVTLGPGGSCALKVWLHPQAVGARQATLVVPSDDPLSPLHIELSGVGVATPPLLTVARSGSGSGTVVSEPVRINCGPTCAALFANGETVTLEARPAEGSIFAGWDGGSCTGTGTCTLTINADTSVTAAFAPAPAEEPEPPTEEPAPPVEEPAPPVEEPPAATPPHSTAKPRVRGRARVGRRLRCSTGSWSGSAPIAYSRSWLRDREPIQVRSRTYVAKREDAGHRLACRVSAANAAGTAAAVSKGVRIRR